MLLGKYFINLNKPQVMGIINVTPDSFSDGNNDYLDINKKIKQVKKMILEGAAIIDIGPESTRPGSFSVSINEQIKRSIPLIKALKNIINIPISIDTSEPEVMEEAVKAGASLINDVRGFSAYGALEIVKKLNVSICITHIKGDTDTMQDNPTYINILLEIFDYFKKKIKLCEEKGIEKNKIIIDPGFGFGKKLHHNLEILNNLDYFKKIGCPILVGLSRKSVIGNIINKKISERLFGSLAASVFSVIKGANIIRSHDIFPVIDTLKVIHTIDKYKKYEKKIF